MGLVDLCTQCDLARIRDFINPDEEPLDIDYEAIELIANSTETAFNSGSINEVKKLMDPDALEWYGDKLDELSAAQLQAYGNALKSRELLAATELYAEYSFTESSEKYTVSFWKGSEETWLILGF